MATVAAQTYCRRRVNPFSGVVAIVETADGRALSADGRRWQIQVLAHPPRGLWSRGGEQERLRYLRFGTWDERRGLSQVPLNPMLDIDRMVSAAGGLSDAVGASLSGLPFPLAAELELWQLDRELAPLALVGTALEGGDLDEVPPTPWVSGVGPERPLSSAAALERLIETTSGRLLNRQWFRRNGGGAVGLGHRPPVAGIDGRVLSAAAFPTMPLRTDWPEEGQRRLVGDYLDWLAPYLLTLPGLDDAERGRLELAAAAYPVLVDALWRLFPKVLDPERLTRTRVEAKLLRANR